MIIAIDGYSSCGKSTVAKALAKKLSLSYIDSGAMYRAVTLFFLRNGIPIPLPEELNHFSYNYPQALNKINISFKINPQTRLSEIYLNDINVEEEIRTMHVSENVSHVSAIKEVRKRMVALQQMMSRLGNLVMDGRDIGTTVFPMADVKIFMQADEEVRAQRRFKEMQLKGTKVTIDEVRANLKSRDKEDSSRSESPLRKADDAVVLDNTNMTHEQQIEFVLQQIEKKKQKNLVQQ